MPKRKFDISPYIDIILFVAALLAANYFWKFTVLGDEGGEQVTWFGLDITAPFTWLATHIARVVYGLVHLTHDGVTLVGNTICYPNGTGTTIVWSCTGLKQSFIWLIIMLAARGPWKKKAWFIPLGLVCVYAFNILRIALITIAVEHHPEWFELLHAYVFKYLFYGMQFLLWLWWTYGIAETTRFAKANNQDI